MAPHYLNVWTAVANKTAGAPVGGAGFEATGTEDRRHVQSCWGDTLCVGVWVGGVLTWCGALPGLLWCRVLEGLISLTCVLVQSKQRRQLGPATMTQLVNATRKNNPLRQWWAN